ncbi:hypothetical protein [Cystobacter fuscus]|uniref:hypothetical protein n=1 Tax=Cystobacter fuscus TaxID=43 RepID=UPI0037BE75AF
MHRLRSFWSWSGSTLWFVPSSLVLLTPQLALGLTALDVVIGHDWTEHSPLSFSLTIFTRATASSQHPAV